jgi:hypothetical protein
MSFTKTISTVAALASIFGAGAAGFKLADSQKEVPLIPLDQKVMELERKLEEVKEPQVAPEPVKLPQPAIIVQPQPPQPVAIVQPQPSQFPAPPPPPVITTEVTQ